MAFSVPQNVPNFRAPHRDLEDRAWTHVPENGASRGGVFEKLPSRMTGFLDQDELPMYKDKPYKYPPSIRRKPWWRRKRIHIIIILGILTLLYTTGHIFNSGPKTGPRKVWSSWRESLQSGANVDWDKRRQLVVEAFQLSWDAYERQAWGKWPKLTRAEAR